MLITPDTPDWSARGGFKHGSNLNGNLCPSRVTSQRKSTSRGSAARTSRRRGENQVDAVQADRGQKEGEGMMSVYGFCTGSGGNGPFVPVIFRFENFRRRNGSHKIPLFQRVLWWARQGLNLRPHPCEGCALPLSYAPTLVRWDLRPSKRKDDATGTVPHQEQSTVFSLLHP